MRPASTYRAVRRNDALHGGMKTVWYWQQYYDGHRGRPHYNDSLPSVRPNERDRSAGAETRRKERAGWFRR